MHTVIIYFAVGRTISYIEPPPGRMVGKGHKVQVGRGRFPLLSMRGQCSGLYYTEH